MKLFIVALGLLWCSGALARGEVESGDEVGYGYNRTEACTNAEDFALRRYKEQSVFLKGTGQRERDADFQDCWCEGPSSRRSDWRCSVKWHLLP